MSHWQDAGRHRPLSVIIAGMKFGYPEGSGAAARARGYARALASSGVQVLVVSLMPPSAAGSGANPAVSGVRDGVPFLYACGTRDRRPTFLGRRLLDLKTPLGLWRAARRFYAAASGPRAVIAYSDQPTWILLTALVARALGACCVVEVCEVPLISERDALRLAVRRWLLDHVAYRAADGFIAISAYLEDYLRLHAPAAKPILRVPILVDAHEFQVAAPPDSPRRIVYVGNLDNEGEIPDLLEAFAQVAPGRPDVKLEVVGACSQSRRAAFDRIIESLGIAQRVEFTGQVTRERLSGVLAAATVLVLPRRAGLFSDAGFPTKLGEYLASGTPVVTTDTGEIGSHLTDGVTAYVVRPGDPSAFAAAVAHVLDEPDEAAQVGARGQTLAASEFDLHGHGERLAEYLRGLSER